MHRVIRHLLRANSHSAFWRISLKLCDAVPHLSTLTSRTDRRQTAAASVCSNNPQLLSADFEVFDDISWKRQQQRACSQSAKNDSITTDQHC